MPSYIVKQPNGLLGMFSTIVDDFTYLDMTEDEAVGVCSLYMSHGDAIAKVARGQRDEWPIGSGRDGTGLQRFEDAVDTVRTIHGDAVADERIKEMSMPNV